MYPIETFNMRKKKRDKKGWQFTEPWNKTRNIVRTIPGNALVSVEPRSHKITSIHPTAFTPHA